MLTPRFALLALGLLSCAASSKAPTAGTDGLVDVPANDPNILYAGRVDHSNPRAPQFAYPGISIRTRFTGDTIQMKLTDFGTGTPTTTNYYDIIIDGGTPTNIQVSPNQAVYTLATGLASGEHTVDVFRRNESHVGKGVFGGFRIRAGTKLLPPAARRHRIEFIGDSITCGYGDMLGTPPGSGVTDPSNYHFTSANQNEDLAWGSVTARALDAELTVVAYSGRGVYRNYEDGQGDTLPQMYLKILPDDPAPPMWNPATAVPDVVVINLGTNDFSPVSTDAADGGPGRVDNARYVATYVQFLQTLRGYYPKATFILALGPMLSDFYPRGYMAWTNIRADLKSVVAARNAAGDVDVHALIIPTQSPPYGEDYHPTAVEQGKMSSLLVALVKQLKGW
jgi:lysophospholipase L1-like esterase